MAGWSAQETALWIRGAVQQVQIEVESALRTAGRGATVDGTFVPFTLPKDGLFTKRLFTAFKEALPLIPSPATPISGPEVAAIDVQGPRALAAALGLSNEMARGFEVAWAWWVFLRVAEKPAEHFAVISDFNTMLSGDGDQILQPSDVEAFVGDVPTVAGVSTKKWKMILVLGFVVAGGVVVWKLLPRHAPMRLREALRGARR